MVGSWESVTKIVTAREQIVTAREQIVTTRTQNSMIFLNK
jgi:hypothetical protein